jgi:heavy metal sensor kinase
MFRTVVFRLTLLFSLLFAAVSSAVFLLIYVTLASNLSKRADENLLAEGNEFEALYAANGVKTLQEEFKIEAESEGVTRIFLRLFSPTMEILASSDSSAWTGLGFDQDSLQHLSDSGEILKTVVIPGQDYRVHVLYKEIADGDILQIAYALKDDDGLLGMYRVVFGTGIAVMLLGGCIVSWLITKRAMSGVERITQTASGISKENLTHRVPLGNEGEEIRNLAMTFNEMLDRIQTTVAEIREVANNIAHDLRSPLTRIRGIAETTLTGEQSIDKYREMTGDIVEECDRLVELIKTILEVAETESGTKDYSIANVDVAGIIRDAHSLFETVAEDKRIRLELDISAESIFILGDTAKLQRVVANLLDNAIKYTPSGGRVLLSARRDGGHVMISVADSGAGIGEEEMPHIFKRFYRGDRSRSAPGSGLGLSLALAIVRAHGGNITVTSQPGKGSTFTVCLPRVHRQA